MTLLYVSKYEFFLQNSETVIRAFRILEYQGPIHNLQAADCRGARGTRRRAARDATDAGGSGEREASASTNYVYLLEGARAYGN